MIYHIALLILLLQPNLWAAEPLPDHPLTISELVEIAMQNNPETKKSWWNAERLKASLESAKSEYYPKLDLDIQGAHGKEYKDINGPNVKYTTATGQLSLSMLLFDFGEREAKVKAASFSLEAASWQNDFAIQKVLVAVLENSYSLLHAQAILEASIMTQEDAKKMLDTSKELHRVGLSPISDVYTSAATYAEMQMDVIYNQKQLEIKRGRLLSTLGLACDGHVELAKIEDLPQPPEERTNELIALAKRQHTVLLAKRASLKEVQANQEIAECKYLPKLEFGAQGGLKHYAHDETKNATYDLMLDLKVPLFRGFDSIYQNRKAYSEAQLTLEELAELELDIAMQVLSSQRLLEAAVEMRALAEENVKNANLAYSGTLEKYKAGKEEMIVQVSNALQQLAQARVRLSEVKTEWLVHLAKLGFATGSLKEHV